MIFIVTSESKQVKMCTRSDEHIEQMAPNQS